MVMEMTWTMINGKTNIAAQSAGFEITSICTTNPSSFMGFMYPYRNAFFDVVLLIHKFTLESCFNRHYIFKKSENYYMCSVRNTCLGLNRL